MEELSISVNLNSTANGIYDNLNFKGTPQKGKENDYYIAFTIYIKVTHETIWKKLEEMQMYFLKVMII